MLKRFWMNGYALPPVPIGRIQIWFRVVPGVLRENRMNLPSRDQSLGSSKPTSAGRLPRPDSPMFLMCSVVACFDLI